MLKNHQNPFLSKQWLEVDGIDSLLVMYMSDTDLHLGCLESKEHFDLLCNEVPPPTPSSVWRNAFAAMVCLVMWLNFHDPTKCEVYRFTVIWWMSFLFKNIAGCLMMDRPILHDLEFSLMVLKKMSRVYYSEMPIFLRSCFNPCLKSSP